MIMTDNCKEIISFLNCEYELFENEADDQRVIDRFNALTEQGKLEGFVPLIIVVSDTLAEATEFVFDDYDDVENSPK